MKLSLLVGEGCTAGGGVPREWWTGAEGSSRPNWKKKQMTTVGLLTTSALVSAGQPTETAPRVRPAWPRKFADTAGQHGVDAGAFFLVDQQFRRGLVHIHHLVGDKAACAVAHDGESQQQPPIFAEQFEVGPQILKADKRGLRILCHLAQK